VSEPRAFEFERVTVVPAGRRVLPGAMTWVGLDGLEPSTSSLSGCRPRALDLHVDSSEAVRMSPECSRLSFIADCFWHGSGTPIGRTTGMWPRLATHPTSPERGA
jgi:hypothetical protein